MTVQTGWSFLDGAAGTQSAQGNSPWPGQQPAYAVIATLLDALGMHRPRRSIAECLWTDEADRASPAVVEKGLGRLGLRTSLQRCRLRDLDHRRVPCLFQCENRDSWWLVTQIDAKSVDIIDIDSGENRTVHTGRLSGHVVLADPSSSTEDQSGNDWLSALVTCARSRLKTMAGVALFINMLAVATPLFVMTVYDRVIGSGTGLTLFHLLPGICIALGTDFVLRVLRTDLTTHTSAHLGSESTSELFTHLMSLPAAMTERSTVTTQLSRLKGFESIRRVLSGSTATSLIDAPFVVIFLLVIGAIAGSLVLVPLAAVLVFLVMGIILSQRINSQEISVSRLDQNRQELVTEALQKSATIRQSGAVNRWVKRFNNLCDDTAEASASNSRLRGWLAAIGQAMTMGTGLATLLVGIGLVLDGSLTTGALIASVMLTWRIFAPVQAAFSAAPQIRQARRSAEHVKAFANLDRETNAASVPTALPELSGQIAFDRVTFRYGTAEPELANVSFSVEPNEMLAVTGRNGAGKSTILKLMLAMHHPVVGRVLFNGRNIRQLDPMGLRRQIAYAPQVPRLMPGTVRENLWMSEPGTSESDMWTALALAGAAEGVRKLHHGLDAVFDPRNPDEFSRSLISRICLARAWVRPAPIVLLDEPTVGLDFESEYAFIEALESIRQRSTVVLVTHRTEHLALSDKALVLDSGAMQFFGTGMECSEIINSSKPVI